MSVRLFAALVFVILSLPSWSAEVEPSSARDKAAAKWVHGPPADPKFFPLAVWLQAPANAARYRAAGINTYVALWKGPNDEQLKALKAAGMKLICEQNGFALRHREDHTIIGWMHGDEPDNAQSLGEGKGYGPPVLPKKIEEDYERIRAADPTRPVMLNLGQGVAWDGWYGRGTRSRHPEDYPEYLKGSDVVSFDIYPVVHDSPEVAGKLWLVAEGVQRLVQWSRGKKVVWNCLECTHIGNPERKATPQQVRAEAWMSLVHGSQGLIYFVHQFKPNFREAALLDDAEMLEGVTKLNRQITDLAPVLNSPTLTNGVSVKSSSQEVPVAAMVKELDGAAYVFAVAMRDGSTTASFALKGIKGKRMVEVLGENRTIEARDGTFEDRFTGWEVHLYRVRSNGP